MDITINTPALFFPAISLVMLAYTNRFIALASVVRNLRSRLRLIKSMQAFGVLSFLSCISSMYLIYIDKPSAADAMFGIAMLAFIISLIMSLIEIQLSTKALELELSDIEDQDDSLVDYFKKKFEKE